MDWIMQTTSISFPEWVLQYLVAPIAIGFFTLLWHLGRRELNEYDEGARKREEDIQELRSQIRSLKTSVSGDHTAVEEKLDRIDDRLKRIDEKVSV
jgi:hypothetical protein